jgi:hypothetical protein
MIGGPVVDWFILWNEYRVCNIDVIFCTWKKHFSLISSLSVCDKIHQIRNIIYSLGSSVSATYSHGVLAIHDASTSMKSIKS